MPTLRTAFRDGRLSYSKVREATRVVDHVDDAELCELALTATAAQLATTIAGYRTAAGTRLTHTATAASSPSAAPAASSPAPSAAP